MKILFKSKDGGAESNVTGFWLIEIKCLFSIALLRFDHGTREAFHSHAFNCISWVIWGILEEISLKGQTKWHIPSLIPVLTSRNTFHKVYSHGITWALTFRGPWSKTWKENIDGQEITLTHGRKVVQ